ncbi:hypothetical protein EJ04DRAFT_21051 [Polyplosphaeria fusca]|uniref:Uncharacterized protein n=1 Tax=Polyplosphaeria fusca TaxID=682080 RepID=A0A9P4QTJ2_9PLEO|nr:hypothetical protein EJ04DRAFT_21051 [Polyplosphaeria fusca]
MERRRGVFVSRARAYVSLRRRYYGGAEIGRGGERARLSGARMNLWRGVRGRGRDGYSRDLGVRALDGWERDGYVSVLWVYNYAMCRMGLQCRVQIQRRKMHIRTRKLTPRKYSPIRPAHTRTRHQFNSLHIRTFAPRTVPRLAPPQTAHRRAPPAHPQRAITSQPVLKSRIPRVQDAESGARAHEEKKGSGQD